MRTRQEQSRVGSFTGWNPARGAGFIRTPDGKEFAVQPADICGGEPSDLWTDQTVEFTPIFGQEVPRAISVRQM